MSNMVVLKKTDCLKEIGREESVAGRGLVLGNSLGSLRHSVLDELTRLEELDSGLNLTCDDGLPRRLASPSRPS